MTLERLYFWLIYYGPNLGQPARVLFGRVSGPAIPPPGAWRWTFGRLMGIGSLSTFRRMWPGSLLLIVQ